MTLPNFLIIGTQKAGTTALAYHLGKHPQIYISPIKEPGFFDFENRQPDFSGPGDRELHRFVTTDIEAYRQLFQGVNNEIAIGEATTWYLYSPKAPECIYKYVPNVKLIVILRNPVDRAYSAFMHVIRDGRETVTDFAQALKEEEIRIARNWEYLWRYQQMGFYYAQLKRYFDLFKQNQIKVYLYEDLKNDPVNLVKDICQFLDVDERLITKSLPRRNVSGIPKNKLLDYLSKKQNFKSVKAFLKLFISSKVRESIMVNLKNKNLTKPQMSPMIRSQLTEIYRQDILKLQDLIGQDLSPWLECSET
jgi:hypothetical protein